MIVATARLLERYFDIRYERAVTLLGRVVVSLAALTFLLLATIIVAFDSVFLGVGNIAALQVGDVAPRDITAPRSVEYVSDVLTDEARQVAEDSVPPEFGPPDPGIARQRTRLARSILDYIDNVRADVFATPEQLTSDINRIRELELDPPIVERILMIDDPETWREIEDEVIQVLERVMQDEITDGDLEDIRQRVLPTQVSVRFEEDDAEVVVAIVSDLLRANTTRDDAATEAAQQAAVEAVAPVRLSYERGQVVVRAGDEITPRIYEALEALGLLRLQDFRLQEIGQAFLASVLVMVATGLYILYFRPSLIYTEPRFLTLLASIFLIVLFGARLGLTGQFYIYPTAVLALLFVTIIGPEIAIIGSLGLALLIGVMADGALEFAALVGVGGLIGALTLKRAERLNNFFFAGLMVAVINMGVATIFNLETTTSAQETGGLLLLLVYSLINGILTAAAAVAGMYILTVIFNLPTALKLIELSQPNQPLLQRLLREAPGTYTHSLQVANLAEQAANKIGANAELVQVAALYHDIGKMLNPAFFTENQQEGRNPHDALNDPYRSADIIISHVTEGDEMARQNRLPHRIRDFIREHHGTSQVYVFYRQAVILADEDESAVDAADFRYPGPKPQSRETAILMLADSCEAAVRSRQPKTKQEISEVVNNVIDGKRKSGQLDDSRLTLKDLKDVVRIFVDMLQAVYHPRIDYDEAVSRVRRPAAATGDEAAAKSPSPAATEETRKPETTPARPSRTIETAAVIDDDDDDTPLAEVPRLRRMNDTGEVKVQSNGGVDEDDDSTAANQQEQPEEAEQPESPDSETESKTES